MSKKQQQNANPNAKQGKKQTKKYYSKDTINSQVQSIMSSYGIKKGTPFKTVYNTYKTDTAFAVDVDELAGKSRIKQIGSIALNKLEEQIFADAGLDIQSASPATRKAMLELYVMDDWITAVQMAAPLIELYGPRIYNWLKSLISSKNKKSDTLQNLDFKPITSQSTYSDSDFKNKNQENAMRGKIMSINELHFKLADVCLNYVQCFICPEMFTFRRPGPETVRTALFQGRQNYTLVTDSNGNLGVYIFPQNMNSEAVSNFANPLQTWTCNTTSGFVPSSGNYDTKVTGLTGPLYSNPAVGKQRLNTLSWKILPLQSYNLASGEIESAMFDDPPNATFSPNTSQPIISQQSMRLNPYYQRTNFKKGQRGIRKNTDPRDSEFWPLPAFGLYPDGVQTSDESIYILITGTAPGSPFSLDICANGEFFPQDGSLSTSVTDAPEAGPATLSFIASMLSINQSVATLSNSQAKALCAALVAAQTTDYDQLIGVYVNTMNQLLLAADDSA